MEQTGNDEGPSSHAGEGGAAGGKGGRGDALRHRPNPGALVAKAGAAPGGSDSEGSEGEEDGRAPGAGRGVYRPPKIAPVAFEGPDGGERGEGGLRAGVVLEVEGLELAVRWGDGEAATAAAPSGTIDESTSGGEETTADSTG